MTPKAAAVEQRIAKLAERISAVRAEYLRAVEAGDPSTLEGIATRWCDIFFNCGSAIDEFCAALRGIESEAGQVPATARPGLDTEPNRSAASATPALSSDSAAVREACAKMCREEHDIDPTCTEDKDDFASGWRAALSIVEARIRALPRPPLSADREFPMQDGPPIPWRLAEAIWQGYAECGGRDQPLEEIARRGGFGWDEVAYIWKRPAAQRAIRTTLAAAPSAPRGDDE